VSAQPPKHDEGPRDSLRGPSAFLASASTGSLGRILPDGQPVGACWRRVLVSGHETSKRRHGRPPRTMPPRSADRGLESRRAPYRRPFEPIQKQATKLEWGA